MLNLSAVVPTAKTLEKISAWQKGTDATRNILCLADVT